MWDRSKGKTNKSHHYSNDDGNGYKHVFYKDDQYVKEKKVNKKKEYEVINPQPVNILILNRYHTAFKRCPTYRGRISWIENDNKCVGLVEYIGSYPNEVSAHGNAKNHTDDDFKRTNPQTLQKIARLSKYQTPREVYSKKSKEDPFNGPKDFKQCQNIAFTEKKNKKQSIGKKNNFADEVLECMQSVDNNPFVQHVFKSKGKFPYFILYNDEQIDDLNYFVSHQNNFVLGIDRTFNLGSFYVTAVVYKNQRVVRSDRPQDHPLFLGPVFFT